MKKPINEITLSIVIVCFITPTLNGAKIVAPPSNTTGLSGTNITFFCGVAGQQNFQEALLWNKLPTPAEVARNPLTAPDILAMNLLSGNTEKYLVSDKYRFTVVEVSVNDEGQYECEMGDDFHVAMLVVAVPPSELAVSYSDNRTSVTHSEQVNFTCTSRHSKPPANLRWFKGYTELTDTAYLHVDDPDEQGFGDSWSVLPLVVTADDEGAPLRCAAELADLPQLINSELRIRLASGVPNISSQIVLLFGAIILSASACCVLENK